MEGRKLSKLWSTRSAKEAHEVLSGTDVRVTNASDKAIHRQRSRRWTSLCWDTLQAAQPR